MSGVVVITRSREEDLELLARCMDGAAWGFLRGVPCNDHPRAKYDPNETGPRDCGPFEETVLGLRVDGSMEDSPFLSLPHPFDSAFRSFHLMVVLHLDRIMITMAPIMVRHAAVQMSFQMRKDRDDLPENTTLLDMSAFATRMATMIRAAVPTDSAIARAAREDLERRALLYSTLCLSVTGTPTDVHLVSGDAGRDDMVLCDGPDGPVHVTPELRMAITKGSPIVRTVSADPNGVLGLYGRDGSMGWDGLLRGHVSRDSSTSVEDYEPEPIEVMRVASEWSAHAPFVVASEPEIGKDRDGCEGED
jgi:hypothetical protein